MLEVGIELIFAEQIPIFRQVKEGKRLRGGVAGLRRTRKRAA